MDVRDHEDPHYAGVSRERRAARFVPAAKLARDGQNQSSRQPSIVPKLEHQQGPKWLAVVEDAPTMFGDPPGDLGGMEESLALEPGRVEHAQEQGRKLARGASERPGCRSPSWAVLESPRGAYPRPRLEQPLGDLTVVLEGSRGDLSTASTSTASRNGARTSSPQAMLARSTFVRMSSGRYVSW